MKDSKLILILRMYSYNALERREASKGGKEVNKKAAQSHLSSSKGTTTAPRPHSSHNSRRNDAPTRASATAQPTKASRPSSRDGPAYDEQV